MEADAKEFHSEQEVHFIMDDNGTLYLIDGPSEIEGLSRVGHSATMTIKAVDRATKAIYFDSPIPSWVKG